MITSIFSRPFFKDRTALIMLFVAAALLVINMLVIFSNLVSRNYLVPVRFSTYDIGGIDRDQWFSLYVLPIFALVSFFFNALLSIKAYQLRRELAIVFMMLAIVAGIFGVLVSNSLLGLQ